MTENRFEPWKGSRMAESFKAMVELLELESAEGTEWHSWSRLVERGAEASGVLDKTASNQIHAACKAGIFVRRGREDYREIKLSEAGQSWIEAHKDELGWTLSGSV